MIRILFRVSSYHEGAEELPTYAVLELTPGVLGLLEKYATVAQLGTTVGDVYFHQAQFFEHSMAYYGQPSWEDRYREQLKRTYYETPNSSDEMREIEEALREELERSDVLVITDAQFQAIVAVHGETVWTTYDQVNVRCDQAGEITLIWQSEYRYDDHTFGTPEVTLAWLQTQMQGGVSV